MRMHGRILQLAVPNIFSNLTVPLLGIIDLGLAGHLEEVSAIGGVALGTTVFNLIYWIFGFLRMGTTGLTAQSHGARDRKRMGTTLAQSVTIALLISCTLLLLRNPLGEAVLSMLNPDPLLHGYAMEYYRIVIWGAPAVLLTYTMNGFIIGMQNTWWPMLVTLITNVLNIALSTTFVLVRHMGVEGIALGTVLAQALGCLLLLGGAWVLYLRTKKVDLPRHWNTLKDGLTNFFRLNSALFVRTLLLVTVTTFFTYAGTQMGSVTLGANALLLQFFTIFSYFTDGFAYAAEALTGHYHGEQNRYALRRVVVALLLWGAFLAITISSIYMVGGENLLRLLTDKEEVLTFAGKYFHWVCLVPLVGVAAFLWDGIYIGLGAGRAMVMSMAVAVALFFASFYGLRLNDPNDTLWVAFLIYLGGRSVMQTILALSMSSLKQLPLKTYYISIGSTNTDSEPAIRKKLRQVWHDIELSSFYPTQDMREGSERIYLNAVGRVVTGLSTERMVETAKEVEREMGRSAATPDEVPLDLDVVMKGVEVLRPKDFVQEYFRRGYRELYQLNNNSSNPKSKV